MRRVVRLPSGLDRNAESLQPACSVRTFGRIRIRLNVSSDASCRFFLSTRSQRPRSWHRDRKIPALARRREGHFPAPRAIIRRTPFFARAFRKGQDATADPASARSPFEEGLPKYSACCWGPTVFLLEPVAGANSAMCSGCARPGRRRTSSLRGLVSRLRDIQRISA